MWMPLAGLVVGLCCCVQLGPKLKNECTTVHPGLEQHLWMVQSQNVRVMSHGCCMTIAMFPRPTIYIFLWDFRSRPALDPEMQREKRQDSVDRIGTVSLKDGNLSTELLIFLYLQSILPILRL